MKTAWIVVRDEKHVDVKHWICLDRGDALRIAAEVAAYWIEHYALDEEDLETECFDSQIFMCSHEDAFIVYVEPVAIRESGETEAVEA